ncbi:MAG: hypothetical protein K9I36_16700 [Bacteroidia bacterium]|nr:hypothetical protein [Bacteroidia bacterium]
MKKHFGRNFQIIGSNTILKQANILGPQKHQITNKVMTETEMYEDIKTQMRGTDVTALEALSKTLVKARTEIKPYHKGEKHLYVRCDGIPWQSIDIIEFLATANNLTCRMVALPRKVEIGDKTETICTPYINIYKQTFKF